MPQGQLFINNKDAFTTWGISLEDGGLSLLMTPPSMKPFISNKSRLNDGKKTIINNPKVDERQLTLVFNMVAKTENAFNTNYESFMTELKTGSLIIRTSFQPSVYYRCTYISCTQFVQYGLTLGKFYLRLEEPNPNDRGVSPLQ